MAKADSSRLEAQGRSARGRSRDEGEALEPSRRQPGPPDAAATERPSGASLNEDGILEPARRTSFPQDRARDPDEQPSPAAGEGGGEGGGEGDGGGAGEEDATPATEAQSSRAAELFAQISEEADADAASATPEPPPARSSGRLPIPDTGPLEVRRPGSSNRAPFLAVLGTLAAVATALYFVEQRDQPLTREQELARRAELPPGRDLLLLELGDPLQGEHTLAACLDALGPEAATTLEQLAAQGGAITLRRRAFELWWRQGFGKAPGARLRLLRALSEAGGEPDKLVLEQLARDFEQRLPADAGAIEALAWAQGPVWRTLVEVLGRPGGPEAKVRADALRGQLERDDAQATALTALLRTGHGPADGLVRLVERRTLQWAEGEGRPILLELVRARPDDARALLDLGEDGPAALALDLLGEVKSERAQRILMATLRDRERRSTRVRLRAILGLGRSAAAEATWPLALVALSPTEEEALRDEARRALAKLKVADVLQQLQPHLAPEKPETERHYALRGLGLVQPIDAQAPLLQVARGDPSPELRRLALRLLSDPLGDGNVKKALGRQVATVRQIARQDRDPGVRAAAGKLYQALTGQAP